ncbi:helix-turn-helix domain-containing protein [Catellatospora citrea]|uniref:helix-turn-helix domain-containing protein n=1 Tax=Catellatospora citrea TaxID=53366 RepID=UPI0033E8F1BF
MSIKVMNWVWSESTTGGTERLLLLAIADNATDDGTNAYPSLATLARKVRLDERTVRRLLRKLEDGKHIKVAVGAGPRGTNRYTVIMHRAVDNSVSTPGHGCVPKRP